MRRILALGLIMLLAGSVMFTSSCVQEGTPAGEEAALQYPDKDAYIELIDATLDFVNGTLGIMAQASTALANEEITREKFKEAAVAAKDNLEKAKYELERTAPPSGTILGETTFKDMHEEFLEGIDWYMEAVDEMIRYGNDGRISHINKAKDYIENYGKPYINVVSTELRIAKKQ